MYILESCEGIGDIIKILTFVVKVIQIVAPIILILMGSIDMVKAVMAGKDDEIKKHQTTLIKRLIAALIIFLIPYAVNVVFKAVGGDNGWTHCWADTYGKDLGQLFSGSIN